VEEEDGPEQNSKKLLGIPFVEDPQHRLIIFFSHNKFKIAIIIILIMGNLKVNIEKNVLICSFRLQWIALLEFSHNKEVAELSWQNMDRNLPRTDKLREMVRRGIPHSLRPQIWMRMSGIKRKYKY